MITLVTKLPAFDLKALGLYYRFIRARRPRLLEDASIAPDLLGVQNTPRAAMSEETKAMLREKVSARREGRAPVSEGRSLAKDFVDGLLRGGRPSSEAVNEAIKEFGPSRDWGKYVASRKCLLKRAGLLGGGR